MVVLGILVAWPLGLDGLLDNRLDLLAALVLALAAFMGAECVRGVLSGRHEFRRYSAYFAAEGIGRLVLAGVLAAIGIEVVGAYAVAVAAAFAFATLVGIGRLDRKSVV